MARYRKKPVEIDAIQFDGYEKTAFLIIDEFRGNYRTEPRGNDFHDILVNFWITTLEGEMHVAVDDWVIRGVAGEIYPCKPDIFERTYEPVED